MASAAPFPAVLEAHARVTVQMIALSAGERGWSTERVMQLSQGVHPEQTLHVTEEIHMSWDRAPVTGGGGHAKKCIECQRIHGSSGGRLCLPFPPCLLLLLPERFTATPLSSYN